MTLIFSRFYIQGRSSYSDQMNKIIIKNVKNNNGEFNERYCFPIRIYTDIIDRKNEKTDNVEYHNP